MATRKSSSDTKESILVHCDTCEGVVEAEVRGQIDVFHEYMDAPGRIAFLCCKKCKSPILVNQELAFPDYDDWTEPTVLYPDTDRALGHAVPESIRRAFSEAVTCFNAKAYTACAIMCRKVLEGVCDEHKAKGRSLAEKLNWLEKNDLIDQRLSAWATELRMLGNAAAHDVKMRFNRMDAEDALAFSEAMNEYLFTYRDRFEEFKKRRADATKAKSS